MVPNEPPDGFFAVYSNHNGACIVVSVVWYGFIPISVL